MMAVEHYQQSQRPVFSYLPEPSRHQPAVEIRSKLPNYYGDMLSYHKRPREPCEMPGVAAKRPRIVEHGPAEYSKNNSQQPPLAPIPAQSIAPSPIPAAARTSLPYLLPPVNQNGYYRHRSPPCGAYHPPPATAKTALPSLPPPPGSGSRVNSQLCNPTPPPSACTSPVIMLASTAPALVPGDVLSPPASTRSYSPLMLGNSESAAQRRRSASSAHLYHSASPRAMSRAPAPSTGYQTAPPAPQTQPRRTLAPPAAPAPAPARQASLPPTQPPQSLRLPPSIMSRIISHLDPASRFSLSRVSRAMFAAARPLTHKERVAFVLRAEIKTPTSQKPRRLGCFACGWMLEEKAFASRWALSVRVGCFPPGSLDGDGNGDVDRFPRVDEWVWGGPGPGYGDWRIIDMLHQPDSYGGNNNSSNHNNKGGGAAGGGDDGGADDDASAKKPFWQRSDKAIPEPDSWTPGPGHTRYWPGGKPPVETRELPLRRFCMQCGARSGIHAIGDRLLPFGEKRSARDDAPDQPAMCVCRCRKINSLTSSDYWSCRDCGMMNVFSGGRD